MSAGRLPDRPALLLHAAADVARVAGDVALRHFRAGPAGGALEVETKGDGSPVTIADRSAEQAARAWLAARYPADGILGEEFGRAGRGAARCWVLDPIDGTKTFVRGVPLWGTLVACVAQGADGAFGEVLAGAAYFPAVGELVAAAPGEGCWWNGARARVSDVATLAQATVCTTDPKFSHRPDRRGAWRQLEDGAGLSRSWGDCYGYLLVATGRAEAMVDAVVGDWDTAALLPVVEEAGGVFTSWEGVRTAFGGSAVATNAALAPAVRQALGGAP
ncbi:histidinol phosphate phosphatase [Gemmatimonadetes bacterium T265]|nr:histidinol phosphate phosphatase [Gemmatimonadetes bacterium T265]